MSLLSPHRNRVFITAEDEVVGSDVKSALSPMAIEFRLQLLRLSLDLAHLLR